MRASAKLAIGLLLFLVYLSSLASNRVECGSPRRRHHHHHHHDKRVSFSYNFLDQIISAVNHEPSYSTISNRGYKKSILVGGEQSAGAKKATKKSKEPEEEDEEDDDDYDEEYDEEENEVKISKKNEEEEEETDEEQAARESDEVSVGKKRKKKKASSKKKKNSEENDGEEEEEDEEEEDEEESDEVDNKKSKKDNNKTKKKETKGPKKAKKEKSDEKKKPKKKKNKTKENESSTNKITQKCLKSFRKAALKRANHWRKKHSNTPPLKLNKNKELSEIARKYGRQLVQTGVFQHNPDNNEYGENLFRRQDRVFNFSPRGCAAYGKEIIDIWHSTGDQFDYVLPEWKNDESEEFTQLIWWDTKTVEFTLALAPPDQDSNGLWSLYFIAYFAPMGNQSGKYADNVFPLGDR